MLITKVREWISCGLAVLACLAVAFGVITHMRNLNLSSSLDTALANNAQLVSTNDANSERINDLINQRVFDDQLIKKVFDQYDTLKQQSDDVFNKLEELKRNDKELKELLSIRHPVSVGGLLNARTGNYKDGASQAEATE